MMNTKNYYCFANRVHRCPKPKVGLFIGRFQPFHNIHLKVIKLLYKYCDFLLIGVGSPDKKYTKDNPFSYNERKKMIQNTLKHHKIEDYYVYPIPDAEGFGFPI